jgi:demethylmenaquinone methyltransferase / 2-methoxy-6-polyprenyl-1,4-benzoquinol methylase
LKVQPKAAAGARPTGALTEADAAANIQQMFDTIAPTYDRANHLLSVGIDRYWWTRAARTLRPILGRPEAVVLDLCCGTGDMTLALDRYRPTVVHKGGPQRLKPNRERDTYGTAEAVPLSNAGIGVVGSESKLQPSPAPILAVDFSHNMLALAMPKFAGKNIVAIEADALHLPLPDNSADLVTSAFGFRNLASYSDGLAELYRVLRPGGQIAILDFNQPTGLVGAFYNLYFKYVLPRVGGLISHDPAAYAYLPDSVARFPRPVRMIELIAAAGFTQASWTSYTFSTAGLYRATKP